MIIIWDDNGVIVMFSTEAGVRSPCSTGGHREGVGLHGSDGESGHGGQEGRLPVYRRIAEELRATVTSGQLRDGDRLPGENALMERYGVARATARQALRVLIDEGLAVARRGSGVYVRRFRPLRRHGSRRLARAGWGSGGAIWDADTDGRTYAPDRVTIGEEEPPEQAARALRLGPGARVLVRRRRYLVEGRPVQLAISYYPAGLVAGTRVADPDTGPGGVYARLAELGHAPASFTEELRARMPSPEERADLDLPDGNPVIAVMRTAYAEDGAPVELNEMVLDAASYVLQYDFLA